MPTYARSTHFTQQELEKVEAARRLLNLSFYAFMRVASLKLAGEEIERRKGKSEPIKDSESIGGDGAAKRPKDRTVEDFL